MAACDEIEQEQAGDVEKQLPPVRDHDSALMQTQGESDNSAMVIATATATITTTPTTPTGVRKHHACSFGDACENAIIFAIVCLVVPFMVVYGVLSICLTGDVKSPKECFSCKSGPRELPGKPTEKGIYNKMHEFEATKYKIQRLNLVTTLRAGCLALLWLVASLYVPSLRKATVFQSPLWKWSLLAVLIFIAYPLTAVAMVLLTIENSPRPNLVYYVMGLADSFTSLVYFALVLVVWLSYFRTPHGLNPSDKIEKFGTWTLVSLVVGAALWVVKSATLLQWKANAVYKRFKGRILTAGFQLYFLSVIINRLYFPTLMPWRNLQGASSTAPSSTHANPAADKDRKSLRIQDYMLSKPVATHQIDSVAKFVTDLAKVTLRENDGIPEIVAKCQQKIPTDDDGSTTQHITKQALVEIFELGEDNAELLLTELKGENMSEDITYDTFQKWVVDSHKNCLSVGYTLIDAFAVVSVLNRIIIGFITIAVVIVWLLVTGFASTKVLVVIASPFLALSFVFGDTCKTFFQGIIFSFFTHPYDVGDRCIIEELELEVKRIGILTTTFVKIGTKEKMMYPNTSLATKVITNLEGEPDPTDMIVLMLDSSTTKSQILGLKKDLESFFGSDDRFGFYEKTVHVAVKEMGSSIKVSIIFTHVMNVQDVSHSQCHQKKNKQRSELLMDIKQFLEDGTIKLATS